MRTRLLLTGLGLASALAVHGGAPGQAPPKFLTEAYLDGRAPHEQELQPSVEAAFQAESYAPGTTASLAFFNRAAGVRLQVFRVGAETEKTRRNEMRGVPVTLRDQVGAASPGRVLGVRIGDWASGMYFARLESKDGRVGFAPFVVRPHRLGQRDVAIVMPTFTWQAYNIRDDDEDGRGNSWYGDWKYHYARLYRPFLNRGVPYHFGSNDLPFLHWLVRHEKDADFLTDSDLDSVGSASELARAYDLVIFPGHHEYVTTNEYDLIEGYRDRGGNLMFLSADNFFWRVVKRGPVLERTRLWRDLGRPEAALIGIQYIGNRRKFGRYVVRDVKSEPWFFEGTGYRRGSLFGYGGIEIDAIGPSSPRNVSLLARMPNVFGPGRHADMTIYRTRSGGRVFAAGAFTMAGSSDCPDMSRMLENLWNALADRA